MKNEFWEGDCMKSIDKAIRNCDINYSLTVSNDKQFLKDAISEMKRYERNWNFMTTKEKRDISPGGIKELRENIKAAENRLKEIS